MLAPRSRALPRALAAACLAAVTALASSCNIIIDAGSYQVGGPCPSGDCSTCGFTFASSTCAACVQSKCCDEADACHADAGCAPLYECLTACKASDGACRNKCAAQHPAGDNTAAQALDACLSESARCGNACATCGGLADWQSDTCASCVQKLCCTQAKACTDDDVCAERQRCYRACTYPSCTFACDAQIAAASVTPATSKVIETFDTCTNVGCGPSCAYGAQWSCVGQFTWPASDPAQKVKLTFDAFRFTTNEPFAGAKIVVCPGKDPTCAHPIGEPVQTDETGSIAVEVSAGFDGYFAVTAPDVMDALVFIAWPIATDQHYSLGLDSYDIYKTLVTSGGGTVKDEDGALFVYTYDCLLRSAPHVMLDIDQESRDPDGTTSHFFFVGNTAVSSIDESSPDGIGGFSNVLPKTVTVTAALKRKGQAPLPLAVLPVYTRPKTLTYVSLPPTP